VYFASWIQKPETWEQWQEIQLAYFNLVSPVMEWVRTGQVQKRREVLQFIRNALGVLARAGVLKILDQFVDDA